MESAKDQDQVKSVREKGLTVKEASKILQILSDAHMEIAEYEVELTKKIANFTKGTTIIRKELNFQGIQLTEKVCENCEDWGKERKGGDEFNGVDARVCDREPFAIRHMKDDQCAVVCGHDGGVFCGNKYGCIHWREKQPGPRT